VNRSSHEWGNGRGCEVTYVIGKLLARGFQWVEARASGHSIFGLRLPSVDITVAVMHGVGYAMDIHDRDAVDQCSRVAARYRSQCDFLKAVDRCISDETGTSKPKKGGSES